MLNSGNNDREQNWLLLSPRVKRAQSDWQAAVTLGCQRWILGVLGSTVLAGLKSWLLHVGLLRVHAEQYTLLAKIAAESELRHFSPVTDIFLSFSGSRIICYTP
jgi:hypothetical protein